MAYHFRNNLNIWKRYNSQGGGAIRFYEIQAIALMAFLKYESVQDSASEGKEDQPERWRATFIRKGSPIVQWNINSRASMDEFAITTYLSPTAKNVCYIEATPFASANLSDARIEPLRLHIRSLFTGIDNDEKYWEWYKDTVSLHRSVESRNIQ